MIQAYTRKLAIYCFTVQQYIARLFDMTMSLSSRAIRRLLAAKGSWARIALATSVSYSWLCKFAEGRILNPSVQRIERILWYFEEMDALSIPRTRSKPPKTPYNLTKPPHQCRPGEETADE
jgi:hypothetical protein